MNKFFLRINGRGNAWPVPLGQHHPFYSCGSSVEYANASFSLLNFRGGVQDKKNLIWEVLIDAGHGTIPFFLNSFNRIPEVLFITHPHLDHILGIDWIAQSYYRFNNKRKYPVYATRTCWTSILTTIPHLNDIVEFHNLEYGLETNVKNIKDVSVTAFPVYHGPHGYGAAMLLFNMKNSYLDNKIIFTGDLLCPILRQEDFKELKGVRYLVSDSNNRFPYPRSNHWGIVNSNAYPDKKHFQTWKDGLILEDLFEPLGKTIAGLKTFSSELKNEKNWKNRLCFTLAALVMKIQPEITLPVHYSGQEDEKYYGEEILCSTGLRKWLKELEPRINFSTSFEVPENGRYYSF